MSHTSAVCTPKNRFQDFKGAAKGASACCLGPFAEGPSAPKDIFKDGRGGTLFEQLGFSYLGRLTGHDLNQLLPVLRTVPRRRRDGACVDPC